MERRWVGIFWKDQIASDPLLSHPQGREGKARGLVVDKAEEF